MAFLFVTAARFRDAMARIAVLEAEREMLINRVMTANGLKPLYTQPVPAAAGTANPDPLAPIEVAADNPPAADKQEEVSQPRTRATFERVESVANSAAANGEVADWIAGRHTRQRAMGK
jgi:hypothetical protein